MKCPQTNCLLLQFSYSASFYTAVGHNFPQVIKWFMSLWWGNSVKASNTDKLWLSTWLKPAHSILFWLQSTKILFPSEQQTLLWERLLYRFSDLLKTFPCEANCFTQHFCNGHQAVRNIMSLSCNHGMASEIKFLLKKN